MTDYLSLCPADAAVAREVAVDFSTLLETAYKSNLVFRLELRDRSADYFRCKDGWHSRFETLQSPELLKFVQQYYRVLGLIASVEIDSVRRHAVFSLRNASEVPPSR